MNRIKTFRLLSRQVQHPCRTNLQTGRLDHFDNRSQVAFSAFQPGYDLGVTCVAMMFCQTFCLTFPGGYCRRHEG